MRDLDKDSEVGREREREGSGARVTETEIVGGGGGGRRSWEIRRPGVEMMNEDGGMEEHDREGEISTMASYELC